MSQTTGPCPPADILEGIAAGQDNSHALREHVGACDICRKTLQQIRDDNRFLSAFATNGALPSAGHSRATGDLDLPGYDIIREIHRGGQGIVYQAVQRSTKRDVAIK